MGWRDGLQSTEKRTRLLGIVLVLTTLLSLPAPQGAATFFQISIFALSAFLMLFAWSLWYRPELQWTLWAASLILSAALFYRGLSVTPTLLLALWFFWYRVRIKNTRKLRAILFLFFTSFSNQSRALVAVSKVGDIAIPAYLRGYKLNELVSCGQVDKIPWKFRPEGRKTRILMRDVLRLNSETRFSTWEIHQVMDSGGYVSYIFRRPLKNGSFESIVAKENHYNRIVESTKGKKIVDVQNLKNFINRTVFTFTAADEGTVSYLPGLAGRSLITVQLSQAGGRMLPPLYIKGSTCDRPNDEDKTGAQAGGGTSDSQPLSAPAATSGAAAPAAPK